MSTRTKGRKAENEYKAILESQGYHCIQAPMPNRYQDTVDLYGAWDLIGIKADSIIFVQVKCNRLSDQPKLKQWIIDNREWTPSNARFQLVIRHDNKRDLSERWRVIEL